MLIRKSFYFISVTTDKAAAYDITGVTKNGTPSEVTKDERGNSCDRDHRADVLYGSLQTTALPVPEKRAAPRMLLQKVLQIAVGAVRSNRTRKRNSEDTKAGNKRRKERKKGERGYLRPPFQIQSFPCFSCMSTGKDGNVCFFCGIRI